MADKQLTVGIGIEYQNNGAAAAAEDLKKVSDAAAGIDSGKLDLNNVGDALKKVGEGAGEAAGELPEFNELLAQMAGKGAPAKDVFQGLVAAIQGGPGAMFESAKGLQAIIASLGTGPVGAFTIAIGLLGAALVLLKGDAASAEEKVNELGETASKEKQRLKELADQTLEFENAKQGLSDLDTKFAETQGVVDRMEQSLARLRKSEAEAQAGAIGEKFGPAIAGARAAGDEDAAKRLEEQRDAEIRQVNEARELADKTATANATARKINDTQAQIAETKAAQDKLEKEYRDILDQYVSSLRESRQADIFPKDMEPGEIAEAMTKLKKNLDAANAFLVQQSMDPAGLARAGVTPASPQEIEQKKGEAKDIGEAIAVLQGFKDLRDAFESATKDIQGSRTATTESLTQYKAEIDALVVDLKTARTDLVTELRQQVADAQARKSSAEEGLKTAAPGEAAGASTEYTRAIEALNTLDAQLREAEGKLASSAEDMKAAAATAVEQVKAKAQEAAGSVKAAADDFGSQVETAAGQASADIDSGATVVKDAAGAAGGQVAGALDRMGDSIERMAEQVTNRISSLETKVSSVDTVARAAFANSDLALQQIESSR